MDTMSIQNLYLSFEVVFPLMVYMMMGFIAGKMKLWNEKDATVFNRVVFTLFLPILLFENIRSVNLDLGIDYGLILFAVLSILITIAILCVVVPKFEKENRRRGVIVQGIFRSNFIIFGMVMTKTILGPAEKGYSAFMMAVLIPLFNILAVITLEIFRGKKIDWPRIFRNLITNPFIIASALGMIVLFGRIPIPPLIATTTGMMGRAATPMALAAMGGCFQFGGAKNCMKQLIVSACGKLLVMPAIWLTIAAVFFGFRGEPFVCLLTLYAAPVAISSYSMAQLMDGDGVLASQVVVYTSVFSIVTIFWITFATKSLGMF